MSLPRSPVVRPFASLVASAGLASVVLLGCNGPSKGGIEARAAARERMEKTSSVIVYDQARQSFEAGQFDRALKQINEAIVRSPKEAMFWVLRGRIYLETGRLEAALESFGKASELAPQLAEARYYEGIVHERWSEPARAIDAYLKASELDRMKLAYLVAAAETMVGQQRYDEAVALLEPNLARFENSAPMHQLLGHIAMLQDNPEEAVRRFNRARLIDPKAPLILESLVRARFAAEQWQACLEDVRRLQREAEGGRTVERMRLEGRCLAMLGRNEDARIVFSEITRMNGEDAQAWIDLASVTWDLGETTRVQSAAQRLLRIAPNRYEGYVFLGLVEESKGNHAAAERLYRKASTVGDNREEIAAMIAALEQGVTRGPERIAVEPTSRRE